MKRTSLLLLLMGSPVFSLNFKDIDVGKTISGTTKLAKAATGISEAQEIKIGRGAASNLTARFSLSDDSAKLTYLALVGQTLVRHSERPKLPFRFGLLKAETLNAYATPGGYVFITEGLLGLLQDESELAGVLAHEITHVTHQHIVKEIRKSDLLSAGQDLAAASGNEEAAALAPLSNFSIELLDKGLSRGDELDADSGGVALAAKAGYDPHGLVRVINRLKEEAPDNPLLAQFVKTHPAPDDRAKALAKVFKKKALPNSAQRLPERFKTSQQ